MEGEMTRGLAGMCVCLRIWVSYVWAKGRIVNLGGKAV